MQVHFRAYPTEVLTLCEDEAVKWNFVNALKEVQVNSSFDVSFISRSCFVPQQLGAKESSSK